MNYGLEKMYEDLNIDKVVFDYCKDIEGTLKERFEEIDKVAEYMAAEQAGQAVFRLRFPDVEYGGHHGEAGSYYAGALVYNAHRYRCDLSADSE